MNLKYSIFCPLLAWLFPRSLYRRVFLPTVKVVVPRYYSRVGNFRLKYGDLYPISQKII